MVLSRTWPSILAGVVALGLVAMLAFRQGGYFPDDYLRAGAIAFATLALVLIVQPPHYRLSTHAIVAIGALTALAGWIGLSGHWSLASDRALEDMNRALVYVAIFGLALVAAGSGRLARHLVWGVLALITVVGVASLISRLQPDVISVAPPTFAGYRLTYPLGYWNTLGAYTALGAILALGLAADPRSNWILRTLSSGASVLLVTTMYFSLSRGAWLALGVGLVTLALLSAHRGSLLLSGSIVGGAAAILVIRIQAYPGLVDSPTAGAGQLTEGHAFTPFLVVVVLAAMAAQAAVAYARSSSLFMAEARRYGRPALAGLAGLVVVGLLVGYALSASRAEGHGASNLDRVTNYVSRQWRDFMATSAVPNPTSNPLSGVGRLKTSRGSRSEAYRVALGGFADDPIRGQGAGSFPYRWARERRVDEYALDAHSLYLETLDELGLIGFSLLALFLGAVILAAIRSRLRPAAMGRSQVAAVSAALAVWLVHAGVDWDWEMPALTATTLLLAATLFPYGRRRLSQPSD